ncbi:hypothetical protein NMG60_11017992 [Bertholletia excelsa]
MFSQVFRSKLLLHLLCLGVVVPASTDRGNHRCSPSSCGNITIRHPFRLKGDPCENSSHFEIACEGNRPALIFGSQKYYHVEAIYYHNKSIRLVDPGIQMNNFSSFPLYSIDYFNEFHPSPYCVDTSFTNTLTFVSCPYPAHSSLSARVPACTHGYGIYSPSFSFNSSSSSRQCFVRAGLMDSEELGISCSIDLMTFVASFATQEGQTYPPTWEQIHNALAFGFVLSWDETCSERATIFWLPLSFICIWSKCLLPVPVPLPCRK